MENGAEGKRTREVDKVISAERHVEGGGFVVRRPFPTAGVSLVDPFLLIDEMGPVTYGPGEANVVINPGAGRTSTLAFGTLTREEINSTGRVSKKTQLALEDSARMADEMPTN